jgi:hypothetical protein
MAIIKKYHGNKRNFGREITSFLLEFAWDGTLGAIVRREDIRKAFPNAKESDIKWHMQHCGKSGIEYKQTENGYNEGLIVKENQWQ